MMPSNAPFIDTAIMDAWFPFLVMLQILFCAALVYLCAYRFRFTGGRAIWQVRWALKLLSLAAMLLIVSPILPIAYPGQFNWPAGRSPKELWLLLLAAIVALQWVTRWREGLPTEFKHPAARRLQGVHDAK